MLRKFCKHCLSFFRTTSKKQCSGGGGKKNYQDYRIAADGVTDLHQCTGKASHLRPQLDKYLVEDRHDFYEKHQNDHQHHTDHDHRVSHCVADTFGDTVLAFIVFTECGHYFVESTGLLTDLYHMNEIGRK